MKSSRKAKLENFQKRSRLKTAVKKVRKAATLEEGQGSLKAAISLLDKYSRKGIIPKKTAARQKSRLTKHVSGLKGSS
jgi:small subunit ribosomal protein S20